MCMKCTSKKHSKNWQLSAKANWLACQTTSCKATIAIGWRIHSPKHTRTHTHTHTHNRIWTVATRGLVRRVRQQLGSYRMSSIFIPDQDIFIVSSLREQ